MTTNAIAALRSGFEAADHRHTEALKDYEGALARLTALLEQRVPKTYSRGLEREIAVARRDEEAAFDAMDAAWEARCFWARALMNVGEWP